MPEVQLSVVGGKLMRYERVRRVVHDTSGSWGAGDVTDLPCPTITVGGLMSNACHFKVEVEEVDVGKNTRVGRNLDLDAPSRTIQQHGQGWSQTTIPPGLIDPPPEVPGKPPYRVPPMAEIAALPHNGFDVVSTFSGCGGSCLGYRMAGFRVVWASEFVEAARETYRLNHPSSVLDGRDIRAVAPEDILKATGKAVGEIDLLDGSPPCASFSTAGKRQKGWGKVKEYSDTKQRTDDLFFEYARLVRGLRPKVFVAENVGGLVQGAAKGYFIEIMTELKAAGYRVEARLLNAEWLGVPQSRRRVIFVGVRDDLGVRPAYPSPLPYRYSIREALATLPALPAGTAPPPPTSRRKTVLERHGDMEGTAIGAEWKGLPPGGKSEKYPSLIRPNAALPSPTVTAAGGGYSTASVAHPSECRKFNMAELRRICGFPDDFALTGSYEQQWERLGRAVPPVMMSHVASAIRDEVLAHVRDSRNV